MSVRRERRAALAGPTPGSSEAPHCSIVVAARNDDHGGDLLRRMQLFVSGLLEQCERYKLDAELVLVEWNPPEDRRRLAEELRWPAESGRCKVRIIEVSPEIHRRFQHWQALPLYQMIAKNVGIRRARGQFILATNIDILFSNELIDFLASGRLTGGRMYRVDRYDVPSDVPGESPLEARLAFCRENVIRIAACDGTSNVKTGQYHVVFPKHTWRMRLHQKLQDLCMVPVVHRSRLHTNACGDFTLMAREHWFALQGYPEFDMFSLHLDSVLCYAAFHSGLREHVLRDPLRIYHIEHDTGSGWTPEGEARLNARLKSAAIPSLDDARFAELAVRMRRDRKPLMSNRDDWGMADLQLSESVVGMNTIKPRGTDTVAMINQA